ncbi:temptin-like [Watersipora subatra]|uniref:temptin-like n=1 Tax=Watersipora subatra TaxID=2589382 RepID=UPI00355B5022
MVHLTSHFLLLSVTLGVALGYSFWITSIPNALSVKNPCNGNAWPGVGHQAEGGSGPRNSFGDDISKLALANPNVPAGTIWTQEVCMKDSDGDGMTNGEELGDPSCKWTKGATPEGRVKGHPGICEPVNDPKCAGKNGWTIADC